MPNVRLVHNQQSAYHWIFLFFLLAFLMFSKYIRNGINAESIKRKLIFLSWGWLVFHSSQQFLASQFSLEVFFVRFLPRMRNSHCGDTGTLLWTHVVLTINENSSPDESSVEEKPKHIENLIEPNFFLLASNCRLNIQRNWLRIGSKDEMKCNMRFLRRHRWASSSKPLYNSPEREKQFFFLRTRDFRILREDCFWDKLKEVIEVDVARRRRGRKNQNTRKPRRKKEKIGKRKLTIEVFGENIAKWTEKSCRTGNFIANADIVYCIYWPSLAFIFLPRVDLLNYFDCLSVELGCALWRKEIIILRGKIAQVALENWLFSFVEAWSCLMLLKKLTHLSLQQNGSSRYRLKKGERDSLDLWFLL